MIQINRVWCAKCKKKTAATALGTCIRCGEPYTVPIQRKPPR